MTTKTSTPMLLASLDELYAVQSMAFEGTHATQEIREADRADLRKDAASTYAPGAGQAVYDLFTNQVAVRRTSDGDLAYRARGEIRCAGRIDLTPLHFISAATPGTPPGHVAVSALVLAAAEPGRLPATARALQTFARALGRVGLTFPAQPFSLSSSSNHAVIRSALHHLTDTLDAELRHLAARNEAWASINVNLGDPFAAATEDLNVAALLSPRQAERAASTPERTLARLVRRGGAALLVGPPGTFKTETAKRVAVDAGMTLVVAKGAPGVEDRDFLGGVYPGLTGPAWVDGPISRAFLAAAQGPTVLLLDEVLRYHHEALNVLVGAMDTVSTPEAVAIGIPGAHLHGDRHHLLPLPNGDHLTCPAGNLTWIMTTNLGDDHLQTADRIDAALLSRIDLVIDFPVPDETTARALYTQISGCHAVASAVYQAELVTRDAVSGAGAQTIRALDARKSIALIREIRALQDDGLDLAAALQEAFEVVALPHCCARDASGRLEEAAAAMLRARLDEEVLRALA